MSANHAKHRFEQVREKVARLHEVQLAIMNRCEEWRPPSTPSKGRISDPTAGAAIYNVDVLNARLAALRAEESELIGFIGEALVIIRAVRDGLGDKFADALEWRYIDCASWEYIDGEYDVSRTACRYRLGIAFDWIDSLGITRILAGDLEL